MSTPRLATSVGTLVALSVLAFSLAVPTAAAGKTRVVDNDGKGSVADCDAKVSAFNRIQKAIDASKTGDVVRVCPGTYRERIAITGARDGLTVVSAKAHRATIKDPAIDMPVMKPLVRIEGVDDVTVKGFRIRARSWSAYGSQTMDGIWADGAQSVTIRANDLGWTGPAGDRSNLTNGIVARNGTTGSIKGNTIRDPFNSDGILATGSGTSVTIAGNAVYAVFAGTPGINGQFGIAVSGAATATVKGNTVVAHNGSSPSQTHLAAGVDLHGAAAASVVRDNSITGPVSGIVTRGDGYDLIDNTITGRQIGINIVNSDQLTVTGNRARATAGSGYGISATEASDGSLISGNDVTDSSGPDCFEEDSDTNGVDNTWQDNLYDDASPAGLCDGGDVPG